MQIISFVLLSVIMLIGIVFACLNAELISINYLIGRSQLALSWVLFGTFAAGCVLGLFVGLLQIWGLKRNQSRLLHRLQLAEKEVENLRIMPLKDTP